MNPDIKAKWVDALRSGKYEQGSSALHSTIHNTFCCLGVLCDLHAKETGGRWEHVRGDHVARYLKHSLFLPHEVTQWAGMEPAAQDVVVTIDRFEGALADHNDGNKIPRRTFEEIAKAIEEQL